jgi:hypothetical protein
MSLCACGTDVAATSHRASQRQAGPQAVAGPRVVRTTAPARVELYAGEGTSQAADSSRRPKVAHRHGRALRSAVVPTAADVTHGAKRLGGDRGLKLLARPYTATDALPGKAREAVARANAVRGSGELPIRARSARRVRVGGMPPIWVLGGSTAVCLLYGEEAVRGGAMAYVLTCLSRTAAMRGRLVSAASRSSVPSAPTIVEGVVPDGVTTVAVNSGGERIKRIAVHTNVYAGMTRAPLSVTFTHEGHAYEVALPQAPGTPAATLGIGE